MPDGKGGVRVSKSVDEVRENAGEMLGHVLVTKQTGEAGKEVKRLYIEEGCDIARELYLGMLLDRETSRIVIMASTEGGMDIEDVAHDSPYPIAVGLELGERARAVFRPLADAVARHARRERLRVGLRAGRLVQGLG